MVIVDMTHVTTSSDATDVGCFAFRWLQTIQRLLGHTDVKTTMIYLQTVPTLTLKQAKSPLDCLGVVQKTSTP